MAYVHEIMAGNPEWGLFVVSLLVSVLSDPAMLVLRRGFGGRGFGRRGFGRGLGAFRLIRILFVLLFTTVLGPIVLVVLLVGLGYWFVSSRQGR